MYAPIDPALGGIEPILRSLGAVLDAHLARRVTIRHPGSRLLVEADVVASLADRITGTWSHFRHTISHVDAAQAQMATAARRKAGHVPGILERALGRIGEIVDAQHLRDLTIGQHPSGATWLVWHAGPPGSQHVLTLFSLDELLADEDLADMELTTPAPLDVPTRGTSSIRWRARTVGHSPRPALGSMIRETIVAHQTRPLLARAGGVAER